MRPTAKLWLAALSACLLALGSVTAGAAQGLEEFEIFIEINDTDGDAGIQLFIDGEGWDVLKMWDPDGNLILNIWGFNSVGDQGLTEAFFESAEPSFEEQPLADFLARFPEGEYRIAARLAPPIVPLFGLLADELGGRAPRWSRLTAELTHDLPGAPVLVSPVEGDDEVDPEDLVIEWMPVADPPGSSIVSYEVIVEIDEDDAPFREFRALVGPDTASLTVPPEFLEPGTAYKFEVLAKEESGNQTISEREFETEGGDDEEEEEEDDEGEGEG